MIGCSCKRLGVCKPLRSTGGSRSTVGNQCNWWGPRAHSPLLFLYSLLRWSNATTWLHIILCKAKLIFTTTGSSEGQPSVNGASVLPGTQVKTFVLSLIPFFWCISTYGLLINPVGSIFKIYLEFYQFNILVQAPYWAWIFRADCSLASLFLPWPPWCLFKHRCPCDCIKA